MGVTKIINPNCRIDCMDPSSILKHNYHTGESNAVNDACIYYNTIFHCILVKTPVGFGTNQKVKITYFMIYICLNLSLKLLRENRMIVLEHQFLLEFSPNLLKYVINC